MYGYGTAPAPDCGHGYELAVPGWAKHPGEIKIRMYVPASEKPAKGWSVHFDFHGGDKQRLKEAPHKIG